MFCLRKSKTLLWSSFCTHVGFLREVKFEKVRKEKTQKLKHEKLKKCWEMANLSQTYQRCKHLKLDYYYIFLYFYCESKRFLTWNLLVVWTDPSKAERLSWGDWLDIFERTNWMLYLFSQMWDLKLTWIISKDLDTPLASQVLGDLFHPVSSGNTVTFFVFKQR